LTFFDTWERGPGRIKFLIAAGFDGPESSRRDGNATDSGQLP